MVLDLATAEGRAALDATLETADALIMNFTARALDRLNLTWDVLHARHPHLLSAAERLSAADAVERTVADWKHWHSVAEVCVRMTELGIPAGAVRDPVDALAHVRGTTGGGVISVRDHGEAVTELPVRFDGHRPARRPAPPLGSSTTTTTGKEDRDTRS